MHVRELIFCMLIKILLKFVLKAPIDNISTLVQMMAWRHSSNKPLFETMIFSLLMHICVTQPQWVKEKCSAETLQDKVTRESEVREGEVPVSFMTS